MLEFARAGRPGLRPSVRWDNPLFRLSRSRVAPFLSTALFLWLGFLVLIPLPYNELEVFQAMIRIQAMFVAVAIAYLAHLAWHRRLPGPTRLDWPLGGILAAYGLAVAFSVYPRFSLEASFIPGAALFAYYLLSNIEEVTAGALVRGLAGIGCAGAILALVQVGEDYAGELSLVSATSGRLSLGDFVPVSVPRVHGVGDHVNMIALALNLTLPFALLLALQGRKPERWIAAAAVALMVVALFFTVSRGAWLSAAIALPAFALLYSRRELGIPALARVRLPRRALAAGILVSGAVVVLGAAFAAGRWESRPDWLFRSSLSPRYDAFGVAAGIARDEPLFGGGPNSFSLLYNVYSGDYPIENFHPHNGYLAVLVDAGIVGVVAVAAAGLVLLGSLLGTYRSGTPARRAWAAACLAALLALAVHSLLDMPNQSKTALLLLAAIAALSMKISRPAAVPPRLLAARNLPRIAFLLFVPLLFGAWLWTDRAHSAYDSSLDALIQGDFDAAARRALTAADREPDFAAYHQHAGVMQAVAFLVHSNRGEALPALLDGSVRSLSRAIELEPRNAVAHANLALALKLDGDNRGAVDEARLAMARAPRDGAIAAVAAVIFEWAGEPGEAVYAFARAVTHDPALTQSPFWASSEFRTGIRDTVIEDSFLTGCQKARAAALYGRYGDDLAALGEACRREVDASPGKARARSDLAIALSRLGRQDEALTEARRAVNQAPDNAYARTAMGFMLLYPDSLPDARHELALGGLLGDPDAWPLLAKSYQQTLLGDPGPIPSEVLDGMEAALPDSAPFVFDRGVQRYLLGILSYRPRYFRESPTTILIPSELTAGLGETPAFVSPRTLAIEQVLRDAGRR